MINRHRSHPPLDGHFAPFIAGGDSPLGAAGPVVGAFIAGPIGALIGRVLAGTIEAVTSSKITPPAKTKAAPKPPVSPGSHKANHSTSGSKKSKSEAPGGPAGGKPSERRRAKKR